MAKFRPQINKAILGGDFIVIDPSSGANESNCGYAEFNMGKVGDSGIIKLDHGLEPGHRIRKLTDCLREQFGHYNLLILEMLVGPMVHPTLHNAVGGVYAGVDYNITVDIPIASWQAIARALGGWHKGDEADAKYMGYSAIAMALGYEYSKKLKEDHPENVRNKNALEQVVALQGGKL